MYQDNCITGTQRSWKNTTGYFNHDTLRTPECSQVGKVCELERVEIVGKPVGEIEHAENV